MAVSIVQRSSFGNVGSGANAVTISAASAANDIIVLVWIASWLADPTSVTDSNGNTYVPDGTGATIGAGSIDHFCVYRCQNPAGSPTTVTVTVPSRASKVVAYEVSGLLAASPLDVFSIQTLASGTTFSAPFTTAGDGEFAAGIISTNNSGANKTFTEGSADVAWNFDAGGVDVVWFESGVLGTAGTYHLDGSLNSANGLFDLMVVTYKAAAGGGSALIESEWYPMEPQTNPLTVSVW